MKTQKVTKREMTQDDRYIYTPARAARILGVKEVEFIYNCGDGRILVGLFNDSIYLTVRDFQVSYATERKERSQGFKITKRLDNNHTYTVRNENKQSVYKVECFTDSIKCNCPDYEISTQVMGTPKVACKHIYAILSHLGYGSLKDYLKTPIEVKEQTI